MGFRCFFSVSYSWVPPHRFQPTKPRSKTSWVDFMVGLWLLCSLCTFESQLITSEKRDWVDSHWLSVNLLVISSRDCSVLSVKSAWRNHEIPICSVWTRLKFLCTQNLKTPWTQSMIQGHWVVGACLCLWTLGLQEPLGALADVKVGDAMKRGFMSFKRGHESQWFLHNSYWKVYFFRLGEEIRTNQFFWWENGGRIWEHISVVFFFLGRDLLHIGDLRK